MDDNIQITITLPRDQWLALLAAVPIDTETYTPEGELVFAAFQTIEHTVGPK